MVDSEYAEDMEGQISVSQYPDSKGKLFRSLKGIIYTSSKNTIIALGHDIKNVGIISPFHSINIRALIKEGVKIDDSLAREFESTGGLSGRCFQSISGHVIYVQGGLSMPAMIPIMIYQPARLSGIVLDYIVKNRSREKFDFNVLPIKFRRGINFYLELDDKQSELNKMRLENETSNLKLENSYLREAKEIHERHSQAISRANNILFKETRDLELSHSLGIMAQKEINDKMEAEIRAEIGKLEISILKSS